MPTEIKTVRDLPEWFDIRRYDMAKDLNTFGWYLMFSRRNWAVYKLEFGSDLNELNKHLDQLIENPVVYVDAETFQKVLCVPQEALKNVLATAQLPTHAVQSLSILDAYRLGEQVYERPELFTACEAYTAIKANYDRIGDYKTDDLVQKDELYKPYDDLVKADKETLYGDAHVAVDLNASDEQLVNEFKAWLEWARRTYKKPALPKQFTEVNFSKWHRLRVLAYMDLDFWAKLNGLTITDNTMGLALFPDEHDVTLADRIRRTVRPLSKEPLSPDLVRVLWAQGLRENAAIALLNKNPA